MGANSDLKACIDQKDTQGISKHEIFLCKLCRQTQGDIGSTFRAHETRGGRGLSQARRKAPIHSGCLRVHGQVFWSNQRLCSSRSHPIAGEHPPFETYMGLMTDPIDHIADLQEISRQKNTAEPIDQLTGFTSISIRRLY